MYKLYIEVYDISSHLTSIDVMIFLMLSLVYDHWDIITSQEGNVEEDIRTLKKEIDDLTIAIRTLETDQQSAEADGSLDTKISQLTALLIAKITFLAAEQNLLTAKLEHVTVIITSPQGIFPFYVVPLFFAIPSPHYPTFVGSLSKEDEDTSWQTSYCIVHWTV